MIYTKNKMIEEICRRNISARFESINRKYAFVKIGNLYFYIIGNRALWMTTGEQKEDFLEVLPENVDWEDIPVREVLYNEAVKIYEEGKDFEFYSDSKTYCYQSGKKPLGIFENGMSGFDRKDLSSIFLVKGKDDLQKTYRDLMESMEKDFMNPDFSFDGPDHDVTKIYKVTC